VGFEVHAMVDMSNAFFPPPLFLPFSPFLSEGEFWSPMEMRFKVQADGLVEIMIKIYKGMMLSFFIIEASLSLFLIFLTDRTKTESAQVTLDVEKDDPKSLAFHTYWIASFPLFPERLSGARARGWLMRKYNVTSPPPLRSPFHAVGVPVAGAGQQHSRSRSHGTIKRLALAARLLPPSLSPFFGEEEARWSEQ